MFRLPFYKELCLGGRSVKDLKNEDQPCTSCLKKARQPSLTPVHTLGQTAAATRTGGRYYEQLRARSCNAPRLVLLPFLRWWTCRLSFQLAQPDHNSGSCLARSVRLSPFFC